MDARERLKLAAKISSGMLLCGLSIWGIVALIMATAIDPWIRFPAIGILGFVAVFIIVYAILS